MTAYYNEIDPFAAAWLRELIKDGQIADGEVDERSIWDVAPSDLVGFRQCHFFAGIGGWSLALRLAGWSDDREVWTGSCPCQPFSAAGSGAGLTDERHVWPAFFWLIQQQRPSCVFGEQVDAAIRFGWLDLVRADLAGIGYALGVVDLPAASVGAPHIRQRLWWVADRAEQGRESGRTGEAGDGRDAARVELGRFRNAGELAYTNGRREGRGPEDVQTRQSESGVTCELADSDRERQHGQSIQLQPRQSRPAGVEATWSGAVDVMADADGSKCRQGISTAEYASEPVPVCGELGHAKTNRLERTSIRATGNTQNGASQAGFWDRAEWLACRDGKSRPVEPGICPLAHGVPNRVGTLRGAGNAIVPACAAEVIRAYMEVA